MADQNAINNTVVISTNSKKEDQMDQKKFLKLKRFFTNGEKKPFDEVEWKVSKIIIKNNSDGKIIFNQDVEHPIFWDEMAVRVCADKYFKSKDLPNHPSGGERSIKDLIHRVAYGISSRGKNLEYIDDEGAEILYDEICYIILHQIAVFNSPVFFNMGLYDVYGFKGNSKVKRWGIKNRDGEVFETNFEYEFPQNSACFITEVKDELINGEDGIFDWIQTEMSIFANGSGSGVNVSAIRGENEPITGGGKSSGLISFLKIADTSAGAIKSGGKTRRAAKMLILDDSHPDLLDFINWKKEEEFKARSLILSGYIQEFNDEDGAYKSVQAQNANNSIAVSDNFMKAVINDEDWNLKYIKSGISKQVVKAKDVFKQIVDATWECGDPGLMYMDTMNTWNTIPNTDRIRSTNPCAEFVFPQNNSCNLASLNLVKFLNADKSFNIDKFKAVIEYYILAMEIIVGTSSYPSKRIAETTKKTRPLGLGYCNMGGLIMILGYPYDSDQARTVISTLTSLQTAIAYGQSAKISSLFGSFEEYSKNKSEFMKVIKKHAEETNEIKPKLKFSKQVHQAAIDAWIETIHLINKYGARNAQTVVIAPCGTIQFLLGTTNNGIEPSYSLTSYKIMSDGSAIDLVCNEAKIALKELGYNPKQVEEIDSYIIKNGHVEGAPHLDLQHYPIFDTANISGTGVRYIRPMAHVEAIAAATPFISGGISKTINLPQSATREDIWNCYLEGWKKGCKALAIYRDVSKWSQPLNTKNLQCKRESIKNEAERTKDRFRKSDFYKKSKNEIWEYLRELMFRKMASNRAPSERLNFKLGEENIWMNVVRYPENGLSEVWLEVGKENPTVNGLSDTIGRLLSVSIQYGVPIDALADTMQGLQFNPSGFLIGNNGLGIKYATSLSDLAAKVLKKLHQEYNGIPQENPQSYMEENSSNISDVIVISENEQAKKQGFSGVRCENCGSWRTKGSVKCGVCLDCQSSYGTCSG